MKNYPTYIKDALRNKNGHTFQHIITLHLTPETLRMTDSVFDINYQGEVYLANRLIESIEPTEQERELSSDESEVVFTAVNQTVLALFLNNEQRGAKVVVNRVLMQEGTDNAYDFPLLERIYRIASYSTNGETISVTLKGALLDLFQVKGITTSMESIQRFFPGNTSFKNAPSVSEKLKWGG